MEYRQETIAVSQTNVDYNVHDGNDTFHSTDTNMPTFIRNKTEFYQIRKGIVQQNYADEDGTKREMKWFRYNC